MGILWDILMIYKSCSRCGKMHPQGHRCDQSRLYQGGKERELRSTYKWTLKSKEIRERANHLCEVCKDQGTYTYDNIEVHHIEKVRDDESKLLDDNNLIVLCKDHHIQADNGEIDKEYLYKLVQQREQRHTMTEKNPTEA